MVEGQPGEFEPVYLMLADVLELHALIIGATAGRGGRPAAQPRRPGERDRTTRNVCPLPGGGSGTPGHGPGTRDRRGPAVHRRQQAHGTDRDARLPRDQRLGPRGVGPRAGRLDSQLQPWCDAGGCRRARSLGDAKHRIAEAVCPLRWKPKLVGLRVLPTVGVL